MNLPKAYNPRETESDIYKRWETSGYFNPDNLEQASDHFWNAEVFSMAMPPPNATGELHIGHALMLAVEDLLARFHRMKGKKTLWLPGTDHAAIATQNVVERKIWTEEKKTRHDLGREELLARINAFVEKTRGRIQEQIRQMGSSCDWSREKYTLSPELSRAVRTVFKRMYDAGLIYRGDRIVNWCPRCSTTLADDEVSYKETRGKLYFIIYPLASGKGYLTIATTRPETMLADTAVAVHPDDPRYRKYLKSKVMLPLIYRELPVLAEPAVDRKFGTGVLKVTPGHDMHDFEIGQKHDLEIINLFTPEGLVSQKEAEDHGFEDFGGLTPLEARQKIVTDLEAQGFLEKTEDIVHNVGFCYRCGTTIEPIVSKQWFVNVNSKLKIQNSKFSKALNLGDSATLKEIAAAAVKSKTIKIIPERFEKTYLQWMENLRDWNISRQIWFGHRIPVWYCGRGEGEKAGGNGCGEIVAAISDPTACPNCGQPNLSQDPDTLDTWFSSSLWTFSTLGWPEETSDLKTFHPTTVLETGYDILFFWVARMVIMTAFALEDVPFRAVYLHGLVRDPEGKKMSKSSGNIVNPLTLIQTYGADALRLMLLTGVTPGNDFKISAAKLESSRNFINKLWNIARFILNQTEKSGLKLDALTQADIDPKSYSAADQWILTEFQTLTSDVNQYLLAFQFNLAAEALMEFTRNKFADWYVEATKIEQNKEPILGFILAGLLKLWHPFIPFVTEYLWSRFSRELLMVCAFPKEDNGKNTKPEAKEKFQAIQELVTGLRNLRGEYRLPPSEIFACYLDLKNIPDWLKTQIPLVERLARVKVNFGGIGKGKVMPHVLWKEARVYLVVPHFDSKKERQLAEKELKEVMKFKLSIEEKLKQKGFRQKAPTKVVEQTMANFNEAKNREMRLKAKIKFLG